MNTGDPMDMFSQIQKMQADQLGAAAGGLDVDSLMGGLGGLLGPGPEPT